MSCKKPYTIARSYRERGQIMCLGYNTYAIETLFLNYKEQSRSNKVALFQTNYLVKVYLCTMGHLVQVFYISSTLSSLLYSLERVNASKGSYIALAYRDSVIAKAVHPLRE